MRAGLRYAGQTANRITSRLFGRFKVVRPLRHSGQSETISGQSGSCRRSRNEDVGAVRDNRLRGALVVPRGDGGDGSMVFAKREDHRRLLPRWETGSMVGGG